MGRGRPGLGARHVEKLDGSPGAKKRLKVILETLAREKTIPEGSSELGIGQARFHVLRDRVLQAAVEELGERPRGRPCKQTTAEDARIEELEGEIAELKQELQAARLREEIALVMPHLLKPGGKEKKRQRDRAACCQA